MSATEGQVRLPKICQLKQGMRQLNHLLTEQRADFVSVRDILLRRLCCGLQWLCAACLGPSGRSERFNLGSFRLGQAFKDVLKVLGGIDSVTTTATQHGVDHGAALASLGMTDE
jgi:hypothetical protein